jgi:hypothetical protein
MTEKMKGREDREEVGKTGKKAGRERRWQY